MSVILEVKPGEAIVLLGFALWIVGQIWLTVRAFQRSRFWGFAVLFIPGGAWGFVFQRWQFARKPFLTFLSGLVLMLIGGVMMSQAASSAH